VIGMDDIIEKLVTATTLSALIDLLDKKNYIKKTELKKEAIEQLEINSEKLPKDILQKVKSTLDSVIR
jgi:hypothetical protein